MLRCERFWQGRHSEKLLTPPEADTHLMRLPLPFSLCYKPLLDSRLPLSSISGFEPCSAFNKKGHFPQIQTYEARPGLFRQGALHQVSFRGT